MCSSLQWPAEVPGSFFCALWSGGSIRGRMAELTLGIPWLCVAPSLHHALLGCSCSNPSPELLCFGHQWHPEKLSSEEWQRQYWHCSPWSHWTAAVPPGRAAAASAVGRKHTLTCALPAGTGEGLGWDSVHNWLLKNLVKNPLIWALFLPFFRVLCDAGCWCQRFPNSHTHFSLTKAAVDEVWYF